MYPGIQFLITIHGNFHKDKHTVVFAKRWDMGLTDFGDIMGCPGKMHERRTQEIMFWVCSRLASNKKSQN